MLLAALCQKVVEIPAMQWRISLCYRMVTYQKIPKYSDTRKVAVIFLKLEQSGSIIEL